MNKRFFLLVSFVALAVGLRAAPPPRLYLVTEPKGWKSVEVLDKGRAPVFPTIKYVPADGRNAAVLITLIGKGQRIADLPTLLKAHEFACKQYLAGPDEKFETKAVTFPHGHGYYSIFEDPKLVGKPPVPEDYKFSTAVDILFDSGEVAHATVFADERTGPTATEAMKLLQTCDLHPAPAASEVAIQDTDSLHFITQPGLDAALGIPKDGMEESPLNPSDSESYFSFARADGMLISGWMEPAEKYAGFRQVWDNDKGKMARGMGAKVQNETYMKINGWEAVFYVLKIGKLETPNLRACRVAGNTWLDVHLSTTVKVRSTAALKEMLESLTVQLQNPSGASTPHF